MQIPFSYLITLHYLMVAAITGFSAYLFQCTALLHMHFSIALKIGSNTSKVLYATLFLKQHTSCISVRCGALQHMYATVLYWFIGVLSKMNGSTTHHTAENMLMCILPCLNAIHWCNHGLKFCFVVKGEVSFHTQILFMCLLQQGDLTNEKPLTRN